MVGREGVRAAEGAQSPEPRALGTQSRQAQHGSNDAAPHQQLHHPNVRLSNGPATQPLERASVQHALYGPCISRASSVLKAREARGWGTRPFSLLQPRIHSSVLPPRLPSFCRSASVSDSSRAPTLSSPHSTEYARHYVISCCMCYALPGAHAAEGRGPDLWRLVSPSERFWALTHAPRAMRSRAHSQLPALAANSSGVLPLSVAASASARASSSAPTTAACPFTCTKSLRP